MDSYSYYLNFHLNKNDFLSHIKGENREILIATKKLLENGKLDENDMRIVFNLTLEMIKSDESSEQLLDEILEHVLSLNTIRASFKDLTRDTISVSHVRIVEAFVKFALQEKEACSELLNEAASFLVESMFKEGSCHPYVVKLLKTIISNDLKQEEKILLSIYETSLKRDDRIGLLNMCFFFDRMCDLCIFQKNHLKCFTKYFESKDQTINKQGLYIVKILIEKGILSEESNWKPFTIIMEALEESSHLSLPTLELLRNISVTKEFHDFWFIICRRVLEHQASLVRNWGLNYIMNTDLNFNNEQTVIILESLNFTALFDSLSDNQPFGLESFIIKNFNPIFESLALINWLTVPFYHVLEKIMEHVVRNQIIFSNTMLKELHQQTKILPKKIKNIAFRPMIQSFYCKILEVQMKHTSLSELLPVMTSIFEISSNENNLDYCMTLIKREDFELVFTNDHPFEFLKYALERLHTDRSMSEIKQSVKNIKKNKKLIMMAVCSLNKYADGFEDYPDELIHETIEDMWTSITQTYFEELKQNIEVLEIGLKASDGIERGRIDHFIEMLSKIDAIKNEKPEFNEAYDRISNIIFQYRKESNLKCLNLRKPTKNLYALHSECKNAVDENLSIESFMDLIDEAENALDKVTKEDEYLKINDFIEMIGLNVKKSFLEETDFLKKFFNLLKQFILAFNVSYELTVEFWTKLIDLILKISNSKASEFTNKTEELFKYLLHELSPSEKSNIYLAILKSTKNIYSNEQLVQFFNECLAEKIFEIDLMTRDQQIEYKLLHSFDKLTEEKLNLRLDVAKYLSENFSEKFSAIVTEKILKLTELNKKKTRYYGNSNLHRLKLRHYQPLIFCDKIDSKVMLTLVNELLWCTNQLNIQYLLEILISKHNDDFLSILDDESLKSELKPQALKSIFSISIMQIRGQTDFDAVEKSLNKIYHKVFPYSMGQNFGVRVYSLLAIVLSFEHVKSLRDYRSTPIIVKIEELVAVINESVKQKNCLKYFEALKQDFRFVRPLSDLLSVNFFYHQLPAATNMPFEEIIKVGETNEKFIVADMLKVSDLIIQNDELELEVQTQAKDGTINFQQKYVPYKYQIPGDSRQLKIERKSQNHEIIVIASLVDKNANLGGLARTCEIFGASNFVIDSLKSTENVEFKSLSKTAERWIKISEIKHWQLFDYLIGMKQHGYKVVGAEQSGNSVSLIDANFPQKCVLLLGNESTGIPADLLSLLDLIIEIPQCGVIRSLNVHVTGALLIWEYAKKFNLCRK